MTTYEYVSVHEYTSGPKEGERFLKFGKGDASGADIQIATPDNDVDTMSRMERERVMTWELPESMSKGELRGYLEDEQPDEVWSALEMDDGEQEATA